MRTRLVLLGLVAFGAVACGSSADGTRTLPTLAPGETGPPSTLGSSPASQSPTVTRSEAHSPATTRPETTPVSEPVHSPDPASPGTSAVARTVLSRAEASTKLCQSIASANDAVMGGNFVAGGLRLSGGISSYADSADPAVVSAARSMLSAGLNGDADGYVLARDTAASACSTYGVVVPTGGVECFTDPCP